MPHFSRRAKIVAVFTVIVALGVIGAWLFNRDNQTPKSFTDARTEGNAISQKIVDISNQSTADLQKVNQYDNAGDYTNALALTTNIITRSQDLQNQAVALSDQIAIMTRALTNLSSVNAQQAALESISSRLALVSELVNYSSDLGKLLTTLQGHFTGTLIKRGDVQTLVNQINTDVNAINNFNNQATQAMVKFDSITANK
jgi:hypothetical protein